MAKTSGVFWAVLAWAVAGTANAGPQHWGSGYPYLIALERRAKGARLAAYEAPLRAKNGPWLLRWADSNPAYAKALGPVAAGDFWPKPVGKEYVALAMPMGAIQFVEAPEMFGTVRWGWLGRAVAATGIKQLAAGDLLGQKRDQLIGLMADRVQVWAVGGTPSAPKLALVASLPFPSGFKAAQLACGDFWGDGRDELALFSADGVVRFVKLKDNKLEDISRSQLSEKPGFALGADWVKDKFDSLTFVRPQGGVSVYAAPRKPGEKQNLGPVYSGKALSRQWLPGTDEQKPTLNIRGSIGPSGAILGVASGRIFGYVNEALTSEVRKRNGIDSRPDAEIAFVSRFPTHSLSEGAPRFGWPLKGETYGYDIAIKNNGSKSIPAGSRLSVWLGVRERNADVADGTKDKPTFVIKIDQPIPPFDPLRPRYLKYRVEGKWPYDLVPCSPAASWKKLNLEQVGERWLVCKLEAPGDRTLRNNRYEAALHSWTFHPIHREGNLADRMPTVAGDPCSFEYLHRKLADAITCVWERSATADNQDVLQRAYLDGYEIGFPSDVRPESAMLAAWKKIQDKWEGWRELDIWTGENQSWEKFDWEYSAELHETGHLFHPLGDLYGNYVNPVWQLRIKMADGSPVQFQTNLWGPDLFGDGRALIGPNACELMKRYMVGSRGAYIERWWTVAPAKVNVQVVDRNGKPVPGAEVVWNTDGKEPFVAKGVTDANGLWDVTPVFGKPSEHDKLGIVHYYGDGGHNVMDNNSMIFTVKIGDYVDAAIMDTEDVNSHSRLTLFYRAMVDPNTYTWKFKTNYAPDAPKPDFELQAAVRGSMVSIGVNGPSGEYVLYRRWQPAYIRERLFTFKGGKGAEPILQDMAEPDSYGKDRFRAIYEVTRLTPSGESLPRRISVCGLKNAHGVTALPNGQLVVATNAGIANPFAMLFNGTIPAQELLYHFRFGHTASKVVPSILVPGRYYITLIQSDTGELDYRFDIAEPVFDRGGYDVRNDMYGFECQSFQGTSPQTLILKDPQKAAQLNPGDAILVSDTRFVRVLSVDGVKVVADGPVFKPGDTNLTFSARRLAGAEGDRLEFRELREARSLACLVAGGKEYVAIADTGNDRIVVWDDNTKYVAKYLDPGWKPLAVAADPRHSSAIWALMKSADRSTLRNLVFDGKALRSVSEYPVAPGATAIAVAAKPGAADTLVAVAEKFNKRVLEYEISANGIRQSGVYGKATGVFVGDPDLEAPVDVAYTVNGGAVRLFAVDGHDRLLRLR